MAKLNICHLFATALVLIRSQRRKIKKIKKSGSDRYLMVPYQAKKCRTKLTKFSEVTKILSDQNFVRRKILSNKNFVQK